MLKRCEEILERSVSAPSASRRSVAAPSPPPPQVRSRVKDLDEDQTIASLLKDESLCAWNSDFFMEDEKGSTKQANKKYEVLKPNVVGLHVKKSHFFVNSKNKSNKQNLLLKDKNAHNECSFVHYTDSRQYVEEYRKNKLDRMKKEFDCEPEDAHVDSNTDNVGCEIERKKSHPTLCFQSYGNTQNSNVSAGFHLDSNTTKDKQKGSFKDLPLEKKRELVSCVKVRGGKCLDQHESDAHSPNIKSIPVANCKPISICNLFPYDNITYPDGKGHSVKNRDLPSHSSLQCKKIKDQTHSDSRKPVGWKSPVKSISATDESKKVYRHQPIAKKDSEYCHIIKKVFGQYDHSKLPARTKKDPEAKFNYILTPS